MAVQTKGMTLPEPTMRSGDRSLKLNYPTGVTTPEGEEVVAQVFCSHDSTRKCFYATLKSVKVSKQDGYTVEGFMVFSGVTIDRRPVARFSQKAFDSFTYGIKAGMAEFVASNEKAAAIFKGEEV